MAINIVAADNIGTGFRVSFTGSGDSLVVLRGVTLASTTSSPINFAGFTQTQVLVLGTLVSPSSVNLTANSVLTIAAGGTFISTMFNFGNAAIFASADRTSVQVDGSLIAHQTIGVLMGGTDTKTTVNGSISAADGVFMGLFGAPGNVLVNSGTIAANAYGDDTNGYRYNNGVYAEGPNGRINNLANGIITATGSEGAGIRLGDAAVNTFVSNAGEVSATSWYGVDFSTIATLSGSNNRLINTGTIEGVAGSFLGSSDAERVVNRGSMIGDVLLGDGKDVLDGRGGHFDGDIYGGGGDDRIDLRGGGFLGGAIYGGTGLDTIYGNEQDNIINGEADADLIYGGAGDDSVYGGDAVDTLYGQSGDDFIDGGTGNDIISGGAGDDVLMGNAGSDRLIGGAGDDIIEGGAHYDLMSGGAGSDTFIFTSTTYVGLTTGLHDQITDFHSDEDIIDLSAIDANKALGGNQAFSFLGTGAFTNVAGQLRYTASNGLLEGDIDGNGTADFAIELLNHSPLQVADLLL